MAMYTKKQKLEKMLQKYIRQELGSYQSFEKLPSHDFSKKYRKNMCRLIGNPVVQKSSLQK